MRGVKGTQKSYGDLCADCGVRLSKKNAVHRRPPRRGLLSYCRTCSNARADAARKRDPEAHRERSRRYRLKLKTQVIQAYGGKCACCGETEPMFLAIDHVNGGGTKHRKTAGLTSPTQLRNLIIKEGFPKTYRLLCHNCNSAMGWFGRCPHQHP